MGTKSFLLSPRCAFAAVRPPLQCHDMALLRQTDSLFLSTRSPPLERSRHEHRPIRISTMELTTECSQSRRRRHVSTAGCTPRVLRMSLRHAHTHGGCCRLYVYAHEHAFHPSRLVQQHSFPPRSEAGRASSVYHEYTRVSSITAGHGSLCSQERPAPFHMHVAKTGL